MAIGERRKLGDNYRAALSATVMTYIDAAKELKSDPLGMKKLSIVGSTVLGAELPPGAVKNPGAKDSVWWVQVNDQGIPVKYTKLGNDLSKWRKSLNKQLKAWDKKSAIKKLQRKRATAGGIIAAVVVVAIVATVLTAGAAAAMGTPLIGSGMAAGGATGAAGGLGSEGVRQVLKATTSAASAGKSLIDMGTAAKSAMPGTTGAEVGAQAEMMSATIETDIETASEGPELIDYALWASGGLFVIALSALLLTKPKSQQ